MCEQSKDLLEKVARVEIPTDEAILSSPNTLRRGYRNHKPQRVHVDASIPAPRGEGETDILAMVRVQSICGDLRRHFREFPLIFSWHFRWHKWRRCVSGPRLTAAEQVG